MRRKIAVLLSLLVTMGLLQGCWNYRELDRMRIVAGCAVDWGTEGKYKLTVDLLSTFKASKDTPIQSIFIEAEGATLMDAARNLSSMTGNKLYWPHCQIFIISNNVAQDSVLPIVDWLMRDAEPRLTLELLISEEDTAAAVLKQKPITSSISSFEIDTALENNQKNLSTTEVQLLYEIYNTLAGSGKALTLPACHLEDIDGAKTAKTSGIAVFKKDRLLGFLSPDDSKNYLFVTNKVKGGVLPVQASTGNSIATLEIYASKTTVRPTVNDGAMEVAINTETTVSLDELDTTQDYVDNEGKGSDELKALAERQLSERIMRTVKSVQDQFGVDIFGFGDSLHRSNLDAWNQANKTWDDIFKTMKVTVSSTIDIRDAASMNTPVEVGQR